LPILRSVQLNIRLYNSTVGIARYIKYSLVYFRFMASQKGRTKKSGPNYLFSIVSISLVLLMLGLIGFLMINAHQLSNYFKENIPVSIIIKDGAEDAKVKDLNKTLIAERFVKQANFVSKAEAAENFKKDYGDDFESVLGFNPLYSSIELKLNPSHANADSLAVIESQLMQNEVVSEVYYEKNLVTDINQKVKYAGIGLFAICILFLIIALTLINNTVRLAMYSNRFLIKSMQLVGATKWFIKKPFLGKSLLNGLISGLLAVIGIVALFLLLQSYFPAFFNTNNMEYNLLFLGLFGAIIITGVLITFLSTTSAVQKYLRLKLDDLY